jgi:hypothetical protein
MHPESHIYRSLISKLTIGVRILPVALLMACTESPTSTERSAIHFDPEQLNSEGLRGPADGLRALHYEFCIPDRPDVISEIRTIDPTLQLQRSSPGRIGCAVDQVLCLGHTHQSHFREVLERLIQHPGVGDIHEAVFE